jgi:uncharacterized membrane protein SpoIIM required for sporulation
VAQPKTAPTTEETALTEERAARIWTPERVPLTVPLAGLGERALAYGVDLALILAGMLALLFVYNFWGDLEADLVGLSGAGLVFLGIIFAGFLVAYDVIFEVFGGGRTPGKRALRLRVMTPAGRPPDAVTSLIRNALRILDYLPALYGVATVVLFITGTRRLGDLLANTFVVTERARASDPFAPCRAIADEPAPEAPRWSDDDVVAALQILERTAELPDAAAEKLCARVLSRLDGEAAADAVADGQARHTLAAGCLALAAGSTGIAAQLARLVQAEQSLHASLAELDKKPSLASAEATDAALRHAGSELMRATRRGASARALEPLSLALLDAERRRGSARRRRGGLWRFIARDVPGAVYAERKLIGRAALVFLTSTAVGLGIAFSDASLGRALVGDSLAGAIEEGANWTDRIEQSGAFAAAAVQIILNNSWVCLVAFVSGLLGGTVPLLVLFANGMHLGSVFGYALRLGSAGTLGKFVLAHGPVELSAICVAGAAGLCLGRALLSPGRRTRLEALRAEAARGGRMLAGALFAIGIIGTVEGFVSPGKFFPWQVNAAVGAFMFLAFFTWVRGLGRAAAVAGDDEV